MLRWGRRAPERTLRFGAEGTASGGVVVEAWVIMLTSRHGLSARLRAMIRGVGVGVENASCTAEAIVGGGIKHRSAMVSMGMSKGIHMEGPCQVSPLQHARIMRFQSCSFLCADSCEAMLIVRYLLCPAGDTRPSEACAVSLTILMLLADGVARQHHLCHVVSAFFLFSQTATLVG